MSCPTCGFDGTWRGVEPVVRRDVTYCSSDCALAELDVRAAALDIPEPIDPEAPLTLHATASIEQAKRRYQRMFCRDLPELSEDW